MAQQKTFNINLYGEETTASVYLKNSIPMIPIDVFYWLPKSSFEITNNEITVYGKVYPLIAKPDTINNRIFVSADFFTKVMNESLCIDFVNNTIEIYNTYGIIEECTLIIRKETSFCIKLENTNNESDIWKFKLSPIMALH